MTELPIPPHFDPSTLDQVWRVPYEERAAEATAWAELHRLRPVAEDSFRLCLVVVDAQNTFCTPGFELYVPGAPADNRRLCEWVYRNLGSITQVVPTLDTHQARQIFHAAWLVDEHGRNPNAMTLVSAADVEAGRWRAADPELQDHLLDYTRALEAGGKYQLTIWPYHAMLGGIGYALVSAVEEAIFFHSIARDATPRFEQKGSNPLTEHYSVFGPEVELSRSDRNTRLIDDLRSYDALVIAGQAKSHCVAWTIDDLLTELPDLTHKVYLLEDCSSPVRVPGAVDYTDEANAAFERFARAGMHVVRSTTPIADWPGLAIAKTSAAS